ncbi:MAG: 3-isopropylmalate dehydrogenase [Deltaproteobacteria bacterium]|nr:3-isopropylmalate dehydrogenase [Deltaproteobacteria bacterium]MBT6433509.1 3-isopropylmalate dehydrogenase [Deltaproteobacteria bacterium]MBT6492193.1 3-isopropylmalate dehydrogenase [Deltaproteobacteria bacterium]
MVKIAVIPGDGIGVEVTDEAMKVLQVVDEKFSLGIDLEHLDYGAERYLKDGTTLPKGEIERFRKEIDAVYLGALGDPRIPDMIHGREILLGMRFELDLFINFRPVRCFSDSLCPLKNKAASDINFTVFRENTEGIYVGMGGNFKKGTPHEVAINEDVNTRMGVERIIRAAFAFAKANGHSKVTMADKSNAIRFAHDLWQRVFAEVGEEYPEIEKEHLYVDALAMMLIKCPERFEVIVTNNLFGDIITDIGAQLQGGMGMAGSGNINPDGVSLFEPVHGSAPDLDKNQANPIAAILTVEMMLDHLGFKEAAKTIGDAVLAFLAEGKMPLELGGSMGTKEVGDGVAALI